MLPQGSLAGRGGAVRAHEAAALKADGGARMLQSPSAPWACRCTGCCLNWVAPSSVMSFSNRGWNSRLMISSCCSLVKSRSRERVRVGRGLSPPSSSCMPCSRLVETRSSTPFLRNSVCSMPPCSGWARCMRADRGTKLVMAYVRSNGAAMDLRCGYRSGIDVAAGREARAGRVKPCWSSRQQRDYWRACNLG